MPPPPHRPHPHAQRSPKRRLVTLTLLASLTAASAGPVGCGADDDLDAPAPAARPDCPRASSYLDGLVELIDAGRLDHLRALLAEELSDDQRADLVVTVIRLAGAFEPGAFVALGDVSDLIASSDDLQALLAHLLRWIVADGSRAPYPQELSAVRRLINTCGGPPLLRLVGDLLADAELQQALLRIVAGFDTDAAAAITDVISGFSLEDLVGEPAVRALIRNVLAAATAEDFDVEVLLDLGGLLIDLEAPPWDDVARVARRLLGAGPTLAALRGLLVCLQAVDPELSLVDLVLELVTDPSLALSSLVDDIPPPSADPGATLIPQPILGPLLAILDFLAEDADARRSLLVVVDRVLGEDTAPGVLADLADLLEAEILPDVFDLLLLLATRRCAE